MQEAAAFSLALVAFLLPRVLGLVSRFRTLPFSADEFSSLSLMLPTASAEPTVFDAMRKVGVAMSRHILLVALFEEKKGQAQAWALANMLQQYGTVDEPYGTIDELSTNITFVRCANTPLEQASLRHAVQTSACVLERF